MKQGFLYLTAVIDQYSRCIVGLEVDDTLDTRMVINALKKAFKTAKLQILNSDQGCQFTSQQYIDFFKENGIRQSIDGKSRWADNIMIERWFRSFKYEEAYLTQYNNIKEARAAIDRYIHTYNFERCILPLIVKHRLNSTIRQCFCLMQLNAYMDQGTFPCFLSNCQSYQFIIKILAFYLDN